MSFELKPTAHYAKTFKRLDRQVQQRVFDEVLSLKENPALKGKRLHGELAGKLSLRVGSYRVIYSIQDNLVILLAVGPRQNVYE